MNWFSKIDSMIPMIKSAAVNYWAVAVVVGMCFALMSAVIAVKNPVLRSYMRSKTRQFRYCHNCKFNDLQTETCAIKADRNEKCGVIDQQAGMDFTVTKN